MKNSRGISLIALVITIIVIVILSAIIITVGSSSIENAIEAKTANEKKALQSAIIDRFAEHAVNEKAFPLIGAEVAESDLSGINGVILDDIDYIRKVKEPDIRNLGVKNTTGAIYIVDYFTGQVYGPLE